MRSERVVHSIGEDAAVVMVSDRLAMLMTVDFFTPIIDDPYIQGKIAACNSTNDVYAKGGLEVVSVLSLMGLPEDMPGEVSAAMLKGFVDFCCSIDAPVVGGQTIICPWPILGGAVNALAEIDKVVPISGARPGDRLILTKPLGIQPIMEVLRLPDSGQDRMTEHMPELELSRSIDLAVDLLTTSNRPAAEAMLDVGVNAATDVTGFGIKGHALNMAEQSGVSIEIYQLPVIRWTPAIAGLLKIPLLQGEGVETAGGLLISVSEENVEQLVDELGRRGCGGHVIGSVKKGGPQVRLSDDVDVIEVD